MGFNSGFKGLNFITLLRIEVRKISFVFAWPMFYKFIHYEFSSDDHLIKNDVIAVLTGEES